RPFGMTEQVYDELKKQGLSVKGSKQLAEKIYAAISDMVPHAVVVRDFMQQLADLCSKHDKPLRWRTPLGMPILNLYREPDVETVDLYISGRRRRYDLVIGDTEDIDKRRARNAATANFVHSIDAAHLQMVANAAAAEGIEMVSVHDCFCCLAPRAKRYNQIIREQFVKLHTQHDLLGGVLESTRRSLPRGVELPAIPEKGTVDLRQVLSSFFAFA